MRVDEPWLQLREHLTAGNSAAIADDLEALDAGDVARAVAHLSREEGQLLLESVSSDDAADVLSQLSLTQAAELIELIGPGRVAAIFHELPLDTSVDLLRGLDDADAQEVLAALSPEEAAELRSVARWDDETAGGLMGVEFIAVRSTATIQAIIEALRESREEYDEHEVQYIYVVDADWKLEGVLPLRTVVLTPGDTVARDCMIRDPLFVAASTELDTLAATFDKVDFYGMPVVDAGKLVGIVRRAAVMEAVGDQLAMDHMRSAGIIEGDELRSMGLRYRTVGRLKWLSLNVVLNVFSASAIAAFQDTLQAVVALAVFLPIISDMSGCSGNQAVAVSMRELSLGVATPADLFFVLRKELAVGLVNGVVLGALLGVVGWLWMGNAWLGLVAGGALAVNTLIAVSIGGSVPLIAKRMGVDPALASGPLLTTITDVCGFTLALGMASLLLDKLV